MTKDSRHLTASAVVVDVERGAVLLVLHRAAGKWVFPGGHVNPGETPGEAAMREVLEETGVTAFLEWMPYPLPGMRWHPSPWITAEIPAPAKPERPGKPAEPAHTHIDMLFMAWADGSLPLRTAPDEVDGARWVRRSGLRELDTRAEVPMLAADAMGRISRARLS